MGEMNVATVSRNNDRWSLESLSKDRGQGGVFGFSTIEVVL